MQSWEPLVLNLCLSSVTEPLLTDEIPNLNLKRSSACTNVSLLNLIDGERDDSTTENESTDDGGPSGGAGGERRDPLLPIKSTWSEDEEDISSQQSECTVLCENLERRRQEAEDLEEYCSQLKESCRKVTKSVEDAEVKTNVLKKNSALLEEKLRFLQRQVQAEDLGRQEREWQEPEQRMTSGVSKQLLDLINSTTATALRPSSSEEGELQQSTAVILAAINSLRGALESGHLRGGPGKCVPELPGQSQRDGLTQKEVLRILAQLGVRLEEVLPQWERTHLEHSQSLRLLREELDEVSAMTKQTSASLTQLRADLDGLLQAKPLLEDVSRHLSMLKHLETPERPPTSCARCSRCLYQKQAGAEEYQPSLGFVNTEILRQMVEYAVAPILEELKQRAIPPAMCSGCQHLQKMIMELEQSNLDTHTRAEAPKSNIRLAQEEALRTRNYLERARISTEDKATHLDLYLQNKLSSFHSQLSLVSQEGVPQSPATSIAATGTLNKRSSCPAELNHHPQ
ncbi:testis-specific serine kinase substrate isoform X3 [Pogona vitticeps]